MRWSGAMPSAGWPACASAAAWAWHWQWNASNSAITFLIASPSTTERDKDMARIALVTGGMGGLGEAICIKLAALGYQVATTYSPGNTKANEWLASMEQQGYHFRAYPCDVA